MLAKSTSSQVIVTLDEPVTLGNLQFGNEDGSSTAGYTVSGSGPYSLTMSNTGGNAAQISVTRGTHVISAPVILASSLVVSPATGSSLAVSGNISESPTGQSLTLDGPGELILSGSDSYTGGTVVEAGDLIAKSSTALKPGTSLTVGNVGSFSFTSVVSGSPLTVAAPPPVGGYPASSLGVVAAVPEPGTLATFGRRWIIAAAAVWRRRKGS